MLSTQPVQALVHDSTNFGELWHMRLAHLHYRALPSLRTMVTRIPVLRDGYYYYVIFIDDYSRKTLIYFLNSKEYE